MLSGILGTGMGPVPHWRVVTLLIPFPPGPQNGSVWAFLSWQHQHFANRPVSRRPPPHHHHQMQPPLWRRECSLIFISLIVWEAKV